MKMNTKYMHIAYIQAVCHSAGMKALAERMADNLSIDVNDTKSNGFILRNVKDNVITTDQLRESLYKVVCDILDDDLEEVTDFISDRYDFAFNPDTIDKDKLFSLFEVDIDGRLICFELDL